MQVGVCSGLVLGFLAAIVAVHFVSTRRSGIPFSPKASGSYGTSLSSGYSPPSGFQQGLPGRCHHVQMYLQVWMAQLNGMHTSQ